MTAGFLSPLREDRSPLHTAGELLVVHCWYGCVPYAHFGIDMGDGTVVELATDYYGLPDAPPDLKTMQVRRSPKEAFARGKSVYALPVDDVLPVDEVLKRAESKIGTRGYCLVSGNCEHFARWCKTGKWFSQQVDVARHSLARSLTHAAVLISYGLSTKLSASSPATVLSATKVAGNGIPSLVGEVAEQAARYALSRSSMSSQTIERSSQAIGIGTVAAIGSVFGGPVGSASAVAAHVAARTALRLLLSRA